MRMRVLRYLAIINRFIEKIGYILIIENIKTIIIIKKISTVKDKLI